MTGEMFSFRRLALLSTIATLVLVSIGGLVRATESGLGCGPDWPVCNGKVIPLFSSYTVTIEFAHRFVAGIVVVLLALLVARALREHRDRPRLVRTSFAALGLVLFQAALGAVVVKLHLEAESVVLHLATAMVLVGLLVYITAAASVAEGRAAPAGDARASRQAWIAAWSTLGLLLLGSWLSGRDAGYVFTDWPLMGGRIIPDLTVEARALHFLHRILAVVVGGVVLATMLPILKRKKEFPVAAKFAHAAVGLFGIQILLGALNIWTRFNASVAANSASVALHLAVGALTWAALVGAAVVTRPTLVKEVSVRHAAEPALGASR